MNAEYIFTRDKLTQIFTHLNTLINNSHPALTIFTSYSTSGINPLTEPPVIRVSIQYGGGADTYDPIATPFLALGPIRHSVDIIPLNQIATATGIGLNSGACIGGTVSRGHYSAQIPRFDNFTALEAAYDLYAEVVRDPRFSTTSMVWEQYPQQKFKEIPMESSAYPWREDSFLSLMMMNFIGEENHEDAEAFGKRAREILRRVGGDGKLRCYTNYAQGDEDWRIWYGEGWREKKLRELKKKWDPKVSLDEEMLQGFGMR